MNKIAVALSVAAIGIGAAAAIWLWPKPPQSETRDTVQIARGQQLYAQQCASCHGARLEGEPNWRDRKPSGRMPAPPHDASGHTWHHPDAVLFGITKEGLGPYAPAGYQSDMPAFKDVLSDDDIRAVLAFIKDSWPQDIREHQRGISAPAK